MRQLPPPEQELRVSVVVPARDEENLIWACLEALANQEEVPYEQYEVILVLDACTDATEDRARKAGEAYPSLRLHFLDGPGKGAGHARRVGMEAACNRLKDLGAPGGLIASTDADTVVSPDWLAVQLGCAARGAQAIGGRIELADEEHLPEGVSDWRHEQGLLRHRNLLEAHEGEGAGALEHWQFSGASLALTAEAYEEIGGLEPLAALEDEYLERVLRQRGIRIERPLSVRVKTSARLTGRAERGLARDLALASWYRYNTFQTPGHNRVKHDDQRPGVSLVLPVDEEPESGLLRTIRALIESNLVDDVVLVGPSSGLGRPFPGITAFAGGELMPGFGPVRGYGDALWRGVAAARGELVVITEPEPYESIPPRVHGLLAPLLEREELALIKGFQSPVAPLSQLVARPLINLHRPELAGFVEPLSPDVAARRSLLEKLPFPVGRGVDLSLLLDAADQVGTEALAQVDLGERRGMDRESGSITSVLEDTAYAVVSAAAARLPGARFGELVPGPLFVPGKNGGLLTRRVPLEERPPLESCRPSGPPDEENRQPLARSR